MSEEEVVTAQDVANATSDFNTYVARSLEQSKQASQTAGYIAGLAETFAELLSVESGVLTPELAVERMTKIQASWEDMDDEISRLHRLVGDIGSQVGEIDCNGGFLVSSEALAVKGDPA
ncbi:hypothetical protein [Singulisphaera sp. PoT]|uniref:hypothetical protein n=1 Tax=Singulisphaera sp. PoT TaxID=3411797 RepID=UPI003BF5F9DC